MSDDFYDEGVEVMMGGSQAPYTTMLKELAETTVEVLKELSLYVDIEYTKDVSTRLLGLLQGELYLQQNYQADRIAELKERKAKDSIVAVKSNVTSLKKPEPKE